MSSTLLSTEAANEIYSTIEPLLQPCVEAMCGENCDICTIDKENLVKKMAETINKWLKEY